MKIIQFHVFRKMYCECIPPTFVHSAIKLAMVLWSLLSLHLYMAVIRFNMRWALMK